MRLLGMPAARALHRNNNAASRDEFVFPSPPYYYDAIRLYGRLHLTYRPR